MICGQPLPPHQICKGPSIVRRDISVVRQECHAIQIGDLTRDILIQNVHTKREDDCEWFQYWEKISVGQYLMFTERCCSLSSWNLVPVYGFTDGRQGVGWQLGIPVGSASWNVPNGHQVS